MPAVQTKPVTPAKITIQAMMERLKALPVPSTIEKRDIEPLPERRGL